MHLKPSRLLIAFFFLCCSTFSFAQNVFIANDFVACGVGLRDTNGTWIVQPIYQDITKWPGGNFKVLYGSKEGVIDSKGKIVVDIIYDQVSNNLVMYPDSTYRYVFTVVNNGLSGLLDDEDKFIVPPVCRQINIGNDGLVIAEKTKKHFSIYSLDGRETVIPKKQGTEPEPIGDHLFIVSRNAFGAGIVLRYFPHSKKASRRYRWRLTLRKKVGVMNDSLKLVVPKKFSNIYYYPSNYKMITVYNRKKTGYYSIKGEEVWAPVFKIDYNYRRRRYGNGYAYGSSAINISGVTAVSYHKKYGIISATGDTVLPFIYSSINMPSYDGTTPEWTVEIAGKEGIYDPVKRAWVLEPVYEMLYPIANLAYADDTTLHIVSPHRIYSYGYTSSKGLKLIIAKKEGKYGLITSAGQEILPFAYQEFTSGYGGYCFRKDSGFIIVSVPAYRTSGSYYSYLNSNSIVTKAPVSLTLEKVTLKNGVTLFINRDLVNDSAQFALYKLHTENFMQNPNTYDHQLHAAALVITPIAVSKTVPGAGPVFTYHSTNMNYLPSDSTDDFVIQLRPYFYVYSLNIQSTDAYHTYYSVGSHSGLYREDGLTVLRPGSYKYFHTAGEINGLNYFSVDCGKNKTGLIDGNGKLLLDTAWGYVGDARGKYIWVQKKYHYYGRAYDWDILDTTTHELLLGRKFRSGSEDEFGTHAVIIERKEGEKLYNMDRRKYILDGNVRDILSLDSAGNYYAVRTCYGHIGIIDGNGKWLTDTIWKMLIDADNVPSPSFSPYKANYTNGSKSHGYNYCVLSNDTGWIYFDGKKGTVSKDRNAVRDAMDMALNSLKDDSLRGFIKYCNDCPSYSYADTSISKANLSLWQETVLFDSLFTVSFVPDTLHNWIDYGCPDCRKRNPKAYFQYKWSGNYDKEVLHHVVYYKNENCISVARLNLYMFSFYSSASKDLFFTSMLFSDGPHTMLLDSLFTGTEWKTFIANETTLYFESHPNIEGNCHNPYMLSAMMKDRFVITAEGIELYPPNYKENDQQLSVPISWEKLKPYLRKDIAEKLDVR